MLSDAQQARHLRPVRPRRARCAARRRRRTRHESGRSLRRHLRRCVRRHLRWRRVAVGARRCSAAPTCATSWSWTWTRPCSARRSKSMCPSCPNARPARARGAAKGSNARAVRDLPRHRPGARVAGLLPAAADLPALPRQRQDHQESLRHLPGPGSRAPHEEAVGEDSGRRGQRRSHPPGGRRRGRPQRRSGRRPVRRSARAPARDLRARRRAPVLRSARQLRHRHAGRHGDRADAGRPGVAEDSRRNPVRPRVPAARQGRASRCAAVPAATCSAA